MIEIVVIAEAKPDQQIGCTLVDRVVTSKAPDWWDAETLEQARSWMGLEPSSPFTQWCRLKAVVNENEKIGRKLRYIGHSARSQANETDGFDYAAGKKAIQFCRLSSDREHISHFLLVRDLDNQPERKDSLIRLKREMSELGIFVTLALADPDREAWIISGFCPSNKTESENYALVKENLSFDPCAQPHRLAHGRSSQKSAKLVLDKLFLNSGDERMQRETECFSDSSLDVLRENGRTVGLAEFLEDVETDLAAQILKQF